MPRVSTAQIYDQSQARATEARDREVSTAERASTMKEIVRPSQNPHGWAVSKQIKDEGAVSETLVRNATLAKQVLAVTENALRQVGESVERAYELALGAVNRDAHAQTAALAEVSSLFDSAIQALNTRYGDRTLLAGFLTASPAFDSEGRYLGDDGKIEIELEEGRRMPVNISPRKAILGEDGRDGVNILEVMKRLQRGLESHDHDLVRSTFDDFLKALNQISISRTEIGARMNRIDRAIDSNETLQLERLSAVAEIEEADPIKVFTDLARDQTALKASLETTRKLLTEVPPDKLFK